MTWPGQIYLLRQMLARTGTANLFLTGTSPIREDPMNRTSPEPTVLAMTRGWQNCPRRRHRTATASAPRPGHAINGGPR